MLFCERKMTSARLVQRSTLFCSSRFAISNRIFKASSSIDKEATLVCRSKTLAQAVEFRQANLATACSASIMGACDVGSCNLSLSNWAFSFCNNCTVGVLTWLTSIEAVSADSEWRDANSSTNAIALDGLSDDEEPFSIHLRHRLMATIIWSSYFRL